MELIGRGLAGLLLSMPGSLAVLLLGGSVAFAAFWLIGSIGLALLVKD